MKWLNPIANVNIQSKNSLLKYTLTEESRNLPIHDFVMECGGRVGSYTSQKGRPQQVYSSQDLFLADNFQHTQNDHSHA